jgi:hypothetical protein
VDGLVRLKAVSATQSFFAAREKRFFGAFFSLDAARPKKTGCIWPKECFFAGPLGGDCGPKSARFGAIPVVYCQQDITDEDLDAAMRKIKLKAE